MFSLSFLTVPLFAALLTFGFAVVTDHQTVFIDRIAVPKKLSDETGYTPDVVIGRLADNMREIELQASSRAEARELRLQNDRTIVGVLGEFLKVTPIIRVAQETGGLIPFSFTGEVVAHGKELEMTLRGYDAKRRSILISERAYVDQFAGLIRTVAVEVMREVDPYLLAAYQFRQDYRRRDFTNTLEIIVRELGKKTVDANTKWLYNLWGIVLYQQNNRLSAVEKFQEALAVDPLFLSPRLNWAVVQARQGENAQAIESFKQIVEIGAHQPENVDTVAAAYSEWGFSLALLNRFDEAFVKFEKARSLSPKFADVYTSWAEVLSAIGRKEEAEKMTAMALDLAPEEVIYTENLIGSIQNLPADAKGNQN
ncbi:Tetratricopeptide repeat protein [Azospirillaceae bacterium]